MYEKYGMTDCTERRKKTDEKKKTKRKQVQQEKSCAPSLEMDISTTISPNSTLISSIESALALVFYRRFSILYLAPIKS